CVVCVCICMCVCVCVCVCVYMCVWLCMLVRLLSSRAPRALSQLLLCVCMYVCVCVCVCVCVYVCVRLNACKVTLLASAMTSHAILSVKYTCQAPLSFFDSLCLL